MSSDHSLSRKRKNDSTHGDMFILRNVRSAAESGVAKIGKFFSRGDAKTEQPSSSSGKEDVTTDEHLSSADEAELKMKKRPAKIDDKIEAKETPSPDKITGGTEEKADETPSSPNAVDNGEEKLKDTTSPSEEVDENEVKPQDTPAKIEEKVEQTSSAVDDGALPALERQDEKPVGELSLDNTPESTPSSSPVKKDEEEEEDDDIKVKVVKRQSSSSSMTLRKKKTMADMGYHFKDGKLRTIEGDAGFTFTTQKAYEELGDLIGDFVYDLMEEMGLEKRYLTVGGNRRFYFASPGYGDKDRILVLIHGSGVVKAGQWARKLIINESLERGAQLEYIRRGLANDWGIVVLNYNEHCEGKQGRCHAPDSHGMEEWKHALPHKVHADVVVVAHSYGGSIVSEAVRRGLRVGDERVLAVALTDSWFSEGQEVYSVNWNTMKKKLHRTNGTWQMYSGDDTHEGTSAACINAVFALLEGVDDQTTNKEFHDLLAASEEIIMDEFKEKLRKKRAEQGDTASAKSLELEGEKKKEEEKEEKEEKKEKEEEASEKKKKDGDKKEEKEEEEESNGEKKEDKAEVKKEKGDEQTEAEQKKEEEVVEQAGAPERDPSDHEEDSDEGVEKDASSPEKSDSEK